MSTSVTRYVLALLCVRFGNVIAIVAEYTTCWISISHIVVPDDEHVFAQFWSTFAQPLETTCPQEAAVEKQEDGCMNEFAILPWIDHSRVASFVRGGKEADKNICESRRVSVEHVHVLCDFEQFISVGLLTLLALCRTALSVLDSSLDLDVDAVLWLTLVYVATKVSLGHFLGSQCRSSIFPLRGVCKLTRRFL